MGVTPLVWVEPVVGPAGSGLSAHGTGRDQRAHARGALDLVPPDPNHDHDRERGDVNQRDENDQGGHTAAHMLPSCRGTSSADDDFVRLHAAIYVTIC